MTRETSKLNLAVTSVHNLDDIATRFDRFLDKHGNDAICNFIVKNCTEDDIAAMRNKETVYLYA